MSMCQNVHALVDPLPEEDLPAIERYPRMVAQNSQWQTV